MKELFESSYISMMSDMNADLRKENEKLQQEIKRKDNIINELKEKINQFTLIIGYYDYNDEGNDEIGENNNLQEELLNIINLDKIKELENERI